MKCDLTFKSELCGYDGDADHCDKTLARCRELGNEQQWYAHQLGISEATDDHFSDELERHIRRDLTQAGFPAGPEAFESCVKAMHRLVLELARVET
jgi:hypothetical protein